MERLTEEEIRRRLRAYHAETAGRPNGVSDIDYAFLKKNDPRLLSVIASNRFFEGGLKGSLEAAGIDPRLHLTVKRLPLEQRERITRIIKYVAESIGEEKLNDRSMNTGEVISDPTVQPDPQKYSECAKFHCTSSTTLQSVYARARKLFGTWDKALLEAGVDPTTVKRKRPSYPRREVIQDFISFHKRKGDWKITEVRESNGALSRGVYNSHSGSMFAGIVESQWLAAYLEMHYVLKGSSESAEDFYHRRGPALEDLFDQQHRGQESWSRERLRFEVLKRFSNNVRLARQAMENSNRREDRTLLSSLRRHYGGDYAKALRDAGVDLERLAEIYAEEDDAFPRARVLAEIRALVADCLNTGELRLTRGFVHVNRLDLEAAAIRHYGSWEKALAACGLVPSRFVMSASDRAARGLVFQQFVREFFVEMCGFREVESSRRIADDRDFACQKQVLGCKHTIRCKPDFQFDRFYVDTKLGGNAVRQMSQLERYCDHTPELIVVSVADRPRELEVGRRVVRIMGMKDFLEDLATRYQVSFKSDWQQDLSDELRAIQFASIFRGGEARRRRRAGSSR